MTSTVDFAASLHNLAALYKETGRYAAAESLYQQANEILREQLGEEHPDVAANLNDLALLYESMGNYAAAESLHRRALAIWRTTLGEEHRNVAQSLNNLAELHRAMGDYAAAEPLHRRALAIRRTTLGERHPDVAQSLNNLALLHYATGDFAAAESPLQQALAIRRAALGEGHPDVADTLNNLAVLYRVLGNYAAAESLHQRALEIRRTALGEDHPSVGESANNLGALYCAAGDYAAAEPLLRQALETRRIALGEDHPHVSQNLHNLAGLCVATHREAEAMALIEQATAIDNQMIGQVFSISSERQRMAYLATLQGTLNAYLSLVVQHLAHSPAAARTALELVLRRKAIGAEALAAQRDAVLGGQYPESAPQLRDLTTLRMQIAQETLAGPGPEGLPAHQQRLEEWNAQKEQLEAELARQVPEMNLERRLREVDRPAVAQALPEESTLVEFVCFHVFDFQAIPARGESRWKPARYVAFVLPAREPDYVQMIDLGEAELVDRMIAAFRAAITGEAEGRDVHLLAPGPAPPGPSDGTELRAAIFDPLVHALGGRTQLFLAPDGDLARLPFEVLPTGDGRRLIDEYRISYLSTGRDVLRFGAVSGVQPAAPLVVADPDFDLGGPGTPTPRGRQSRDLDRNQLHFARLPGTRMEGERVADMLDVRPWLESAALEAPLKACRSPRILHIATHGFFLADQKRDPDEPGSGSRALRWGGSGKLGHLSRLENPLLRSGLALAGANTWLKGGTLPAEAEDGLLTAEDVSGLDLLTTELVVLSACETGLGEVRVGEGVFGLRRAFVLAGAKTLVMSLWKVPDQQTQELMVDYYQRILAGQPRADALRAAQLAMRARYPNPFYWGAFICQGNPEPLS